ncbi:MAG: hypothetical protein ACTSSG_09810 [Candidatus Heimdallarchaeaceae archaeon]
MTTLFKYDHGIKFQRTSDKMKLIADPTTVQATKGCKAALITHAHTDHSIAFPNENIKAYSTRLAGGLYEKLTGRQPKNTHFVEYGQVHKIEDVEMKFIPAGHLLGASQIIFYFDDFTLCYTGDICTENMITVPSASTPDDSIDILIIEATYGSPNLYFDSRERTKISLLNWVAESLQNKRIPVINIGHLGAAQEIIAFFNEMLSIDIYCDERTSEINNFYLNEGIKIKWKSFDSLNDSNFKLENSIFLLPRATKELPTLFSEYKITRGIVTGQASRFAFTRFNRSFPFSMHSNCDELVEYTKKVNPRKVYTIYGFDSELAATIRKQLDLPAKPLKLVKKRVTLKEFL